MKNRSNKLLTIACILGLLLLNACFSQGQISPTATPALRSLDVVEPTIQPELEAASRPEGEVISESTLGFNISGWS